MRILQFLCLKNICQFLDVCQNTFHIPQQLLFDALELYNVADFGKVLKALAYLSWTDEAQKSGIG